MSQDLYSRLDRLDEPTLRSIADVLELRGRHPQQVAIRQAYLAQLGDLRGQRILDVGCGSGVVTRDLARMAGPGGAATGVDPTPVFVEVARRIGREHHLSNLDFGVQDGRSVRFDDRTFDLATSITVLCHVPRRADVLREMARVVRPGGQVLIVDGEYVANQLEHPDRRLTQQIVDAWRATTVDDPRLMRRIGPLVEAAGLQPRALHGHVHLEAGRVDEATSFIWQWALFAVRQATGAGAVQDGEAARWVEQLRAINQRGELFGSVTYVSLLASRP